MSKSLAGVDSVEDLIHIKILPHANRYFKVGKNLSTEDRVEVLSTLARNLDVFAWGPYDVLGVDLAFIVHRLNLDCLVPPRKQRPRREANPHVEAIKEEVEKLKQARAIKEVYIPEWLANTVVVKKKSHKWRVCIDFTDLNRVCSKDPFSVPKINQLVDVIVGH